MPCRDITCKTCFPPMPYVEPCKRAADLQSAAAERQRRWDIDYLKLARFWADTKSKDPSAKVGAVLVSERNSVVGLGYNGFPKGVADSEDRLNDKPVKYRFVVHAEINAILTSPCATAGCTLYCTLFTCNECAKSVIQAGIKRVVAPPVTADVSRWQESFDAAIAMYREAGVQVDFIDPQEQTETKPLHIVACHTLTEAKIHVWRLVDAIPLAFGDPIPKRRVDRALVIMPPYQLPPDQRFKAEQWCQGLSRITDDLRVENAK